MPSLKFLGKSVVILLTLFLLTSSVIIPKSIPNNDLAISTDHIDKSLVHDDKVKVNAIYQVALKEALADYFEKAIARGEIVGAGVSIVKGDSIEISEGFGKRNIKNNQEVDGETVFRLGSLSKGFAGVLAAYLNCEGELDWSDKVSDYVPEFKLGDRNNTDQITLATILSHTSGAPYHSYTNLVEEGLSLTEIARRFQDVKPLDKPSHTYSYQNAMFALCGEMMHQETGQDIRTLLSNTFFKPLGMNHISMKYDDLAQNENVAMPYSKKRYGWRSLKLNHNYYNAVAAGGINASATDMAKWMELLLGHHPEIMDQSALQDAFNPYVEIGGRSKYYQRWTGHINSYYGFGWRIHTFKEKGTTEEKTIYHHGGSVNNYRNEIALYPEDDLGICVLLNSNSKLAKHVIPDLYDLVKKVFEDSQIQQVSNPVNLAIVDSNIID